MIEVDGRTIGRGTRGPIVAKLQQLYSQLMDSEAAAGRVATLDDSQE